jgi:hypothetical protein
VIGSGGVFIKAGGFGNGMEDAVVGRLCTISDFAWLYGHILGLSFGRWLVIWVLSFLGAYIGSFVW